MKIDENKHSNTHFWAYLVDLAVCDSLVLQEWLLPLVVISWENLDQDHPLGDEIRVLIVGWSTLDRI